MAGDFGFGCVVQIDTGTDITDIAQITSINGPSYALDTFDATTHDSNTSNFREFGAGLRDGGEMTFELNFDPNGTSHKDDTNGLLYRLTQGTRELFTIFTPDGDAVQFYGYCASFEPSFPHDDVITASATIKTDGKPAWSYL